MARRADAYRTLPSSDIPSTRVTIAASSSSSRGADGPRLDEHHREAPRAQLHPQGIGERAQGVLGRAQCAAEGQGDPAPDGSDGDDPTAACPQQRKHGLGDGHLSDDVDLELAPQLLERDQFDRTRDADPGVVHQAREPGRRVGDLRGELGGDGRDQGGVGDVEPHGPDPPRRVRRGDPLAVGEVPDPGVHQEPGLGQGQRARPSDSRRRPGDQHPTPDSTDRTSHGRSPDGPCPGQGLEQDVFR